MGVSLCGLVASLTYGVAQIFLLFRFTTYLWTLPLASTESSCLRANAQRYYSASSSQEGEIISISPEGAMMPNIHGKVATLVRCFRHIIVTF